MQSLISLSWRPPRYITSSLIVGMGGLLNGIDTGTIGAVLSLPAFTDSFGVISPATAGWIVSSILLSATIFSLAAGALSDSLGRTRSIAIGSLVYVVGAALECAAINLAMLITGRLIVGAGQGLFLSTLLVYVAEISPPRIRSTLATVVQSFLTAGLVGGFFICYGTEGIPGSLSWRLPFAIHAVIAILVTLAAQFFLPESPRWLVSRGRHAEAVAAWDLLGVSAAEREKDSLPTPTPAATFLEASDTNNPWLIRSKSQARLRVKALLKTFAGDARKPLLLGITYMFLQQLSGIDGVLYYAPQLFEKAGLASSSRFLASGVSAILIFVSTIVAMLYADRWGRRPSTIYGGLVLLTCMLLMATLYAADAVNGAGRWVVIPSIYIFSCAYSMTWAIGLKIYASELQPLSSRASAMSLCQSANALTNFFVAFITPVLLSASSSAAYWLFGGCISVTILISTFYMVETKGLELENIGQALRDHRSREVSAVKKLKAVSTLVSHWVNGSQVNARNAAITTSIELQQRATA